jgi:hypothetical protein
MRKLDLDRGGVVIYQMLLQRPDGGIVGNVPIPVQVNIVGDTVRAEINGSTEWTPALNEVYHKISKDTDKQQALLESLCSEVVVAAMKDAMQPYLASERTPITEDDPQTKLFGDF